MLSVHAPEDDNKVFGITFRTPPKDSTGVAHILEHSVLCGSRKFKTKEPFVDLLKGSVNTFLNAFTYPDRTCYPVASMNTKDFYNLIDVYMDAVLYPRAIENPQVLQQEGWHYELEKESDPLTYKGVVFNEMKGVYSSSDALLGKATQEALFPHNAYSVDSGGDPKHIPDLTFNDFKNFHSTTYHPSNSRIYFYGDDDLVKRLDLMHSYLLDFDLRNKSLSDKTVVVPQKVLHNLCDDPPIEVKYPVDNESLDPNSYITTVNWLLSKDGVAMSSKDELTLTILNHLLLGTSSAVLQKTLTESQLGESVTGGGLSDELIQPTFSVGMKGVNEKNTSKVHELIISTLEKLIETGFDAEAIRASVNSVEFDLREFNSGGFPKGLSLMLGFMNNWIYDRDPFDAVRFEECLNEIKEDLKSGKPLFQDIIREYFVQNGHRVSVVMVPDVDVANDELERERSELQRVKANLSHQQIQDIMRATAQLKAAQEAEDSPEAKATIPRLSLHDLDTSPREIPMSLQRESNPIKYDLLLHPLSSGGILYADIGLDFSAVPLEDIPLLPLFAKMLTESGTSTMDQVALSRFIGAETGGVGASWNSGLRTSKIRGTVKEDQNDVTMYLMLRGKCTSEKIEALFGIFSDILLNAKLDNQKRAIEMLLEVKARRVNSVVGNGHSYGITRFAADKSFLGYLAENMGGLSYLRNIDDLLGLAEHDWPKLLKRLEGIRGAIVNKSGLSNEHDNALPATVVVSLTGDEKLLQGAKQYASGFIDVLNAARSANNAVVNHELRGVVHEWVELGSTKDDNNENCAVINEGISVPSQVNYVVKGGSLFQPGEEVRGSHAVVSRYLGTTYLWDTVRVIGGAYGGFGRFSPHSGRYVFASYRDPNIVETLNIYDKAGNSLRDSVREKNDLVEVKIEDGTADTSPYYSLPLLTQDDITQSIVGYTGDLDSPQSVDQKGFTSLCNYIAGETPDDRTQWRHEVLNTKLEDFREFADKLIGLTNSDHTSTTRHSKTEVVVIGSQASLDKANAALPDNKKLIISTAFKRGSLPDE